MKNTLEWAKSVFIFWWCVAAKGRCRRRWRRQRRHSPYRSTRGGAEGVAATLAHWKKRRRRCTPRTERVKGCEVDTDERERRATPSNKAETPDPLFHLQNNQTSRRPARDSRTAACWTLALKGMLRSTTQIHPQREDRK
jgi:hypothetical protein